MDTIEITQAAEHNLKHVDLSIPRDKLVVFTGVSGSGKSSLAFDTIFAEGQRRYIESLSRYARQYMGQLEKPDVESIEGLSPTISIDQKSASRSPRSTVGTLTEILDFLRLLYAKVGQPHCPECDREISAQSLQQMVERVLALPEGTRLQLMAPVVRGRKGEYNALFQEFIKEGFTRVHIDGDTHLLEELPEDYRLERMKTHDIAVVIDRVVIKPEDKDQVIRVTQAVERALKKAEGFLLVDALDEPEDERFTLYSQHLACPEHPNIGMGEMAPRMFSFNSPYGACPSCEGLGLALDISEAMLVPEPEKSLEEEALVPLKKLVGRHYKKYIKGLCKQFKIRARVAFSKLTDREKQYLLYGDATEEETPTEGLLKQLSTELQHQATEYDDMLWEELAADFQGVIPILQRQYLYGTAAQKEYIRQFMVEAPCPTCEGQRLKPLSLATTLGGKSIHEVGELSIQKALAFANTLPKQLTDTQLLIAREPLHEVTSRLQFLLNVGLDYLTLNRRASTLSGGEAQRIRLASQIGAGLSGVLYVLDEPSIGLHPKNNAQLIQTLLNLRDLGNSLIVVEHDEDTIRAADWVVDIGPGAGRHGGHIVASGPVSKVKKTKESATALYLTGEKKLAPPNKPRKGNGNHLTIQGATLHNLNNLTVKLPLGKLICVTGFSGSGKSTLVFDVLFQTLRWHFGKHHTKPAGVNAIKGLEHIDKCIQIDQSPIGRSPRSNPATYTGIFDHIRNLFAHCEEAKIKGFKPGHFSFNVATGRCPQCRGDGMIKQEMTFLPNVYTLCPLCRGKRYNAETLEVHYNNKTIADVLAMTVEEACTFFEDHPRIHTQLSVLNDVGLGYMALGQSATTVSGGEAQRIKLATEFCKRSTGNTIYLLDEPTIGLHWQDLENLMVILNRLVDAGNTVLIIEHNLELIKMADHIIDLGPEGGERGGDIVAQGTPQELVKKHLKQSATAQYLKTVL